VSPTAQPPPLFAGVAAAMPSAAAAAAAAAEMDAELASDSAPFIQQEGREFRPSQRRAWKAAVGLTVGALAGVAYMAQTPSRPQHTAVPAAVSLAADGTAADAALSPVCAGEGESCQDSKCCTAGGPKGLQCYTKSDSWAECDQTCAKGVHEGEKHGIYDQYGTFQLDSWSCEEVGTRSDPGCETFERDHLCPSDRCMWKGSCLAVCDAFGDEASCTPNDKCMWKGKCMEACDTFSSGKTCGPSDKCAWKGDKCEEGCWTLGGWDTCSKVDRCSWDGSQCQDNCWTYAAEGECGDHTDRCMWNGGQCKAACNTFNSKDGCPHDLGCFWDKPEGQPSACVVDPCGVPGEDCTSSKCCSAERGGGDMTCFKKDDTWASCSNTCDPNSGDTKDWSCKALGNRTKYPSGCSWAGQNCEKDALCCNIGFSCVVKDDTWTACVQTVKKTTWVTKAVPVPSDWKGTFIAGGRTEYSVPAVAEGQPTSGASLYCFMAILPDSPEVTLMLLAKRNKASIFACDASDVFHSWKSATAGWDTGESTLTNTDVFINVWELVHQKGVYKNFDWTVKVDADAVLVPDRLKSHINALRPPAYRAIYLKNNAMDAGLGNNGFLGAVEVFSKVAAQIYFDNAEGCHTTLGINSGEDGFFKGCMDALGVGFMTDAQLFNPDRSPGACSMGQRAAFHPLKSPVNWQCCIDIVNGKPHNVEYGNCNLGYDLNYDFSDVA